MTTNKHPSLILLAFCLFFPILSFSEVKLPDFSQYKVVKYRKKAFFTYLKPFAKQVNTAIIKDRKTLESMKQHQGKLSTDNITWLNHKAKTYKIKTSSTPNIIKQLETKMDIIPPALLLAQAANESAWGTSRFAKLGNNLFGQWCYKPNCGIVPLKRSKGLTHQVQKFDSPFDSIAAYALNLNSNSSYHYLRQLRAALRQSGKMITGFKLAQGLNKYSERGMAYVRDIQKMIINNNLDT